MTRRHLPIVADARPVTASLPSLEHGVGRGVLAAPAAWYEDPQLSGPTRLTVTDDGRVYGHIAQWGTPHRATGVMSDVVQGDDFTGFHVSRIRTAEGTDLDVGTLTIGGGHASTDPSVGAQAALEHYDEVGTGWAHVRAGTDEFGEWVAGSVAPGVTDLMLHKARAYAPSGDWRWVQQPGEADGRYRLVAVASVVTPGFPVQEMRAQVASAAPGEHLPLVATGWALTAALADPEIRPGDGPRFRIPVAVPEGVYSRDGRQILPGALTWSVGPWPLYAQTEQEMGHDGAEVVGTILAWERNSDGIVSGVGAFLMTPAAQVAATMADSGALRGISVDLAAVKGVFLGQEITIVDTAPTTEEDPDGDDVTTIVIPDEPFDSTEPWMDVESAELCGATMCGTPAFGDAYLVLIDPLPEYPALAAGAAPVIVRPREIRAFRMRRPAPAATVLSAEEQIAELRAIVEQQGQQIAALTAAVTPSLAVTAALRPQARRAVLERLGS